MSGVLIGLGLRIVAILICITVFEFSKAAISTALGDTVPKERGWLTLNPFKFFEPIGFFLFLFYGFGWGHPVETSALFYKNRKRDTILTYSLPMVICLVLGIVVIKLLYVMPTEGTVYTYLFAFLSFLSNYFINIAVFNLIPLTPMAGSKLIKLFLSPNAAMSFAQNEKLYQMIFMFLWFFGFIPQILKVIVNFIYNLL